MAHHPHSPARCGIVPPYILEALAQHDDAVVREAADRTLALTAGFGENRSTTTPQSSAEGATAPREHRSVYDARNSETLPGHLVRDEGAAAAQDVAVNEAYDGLGDTWTLYEDVVRPELHRRQRPHPDRLGAFRAALRQRLLGRHSRWSSATATACCSTASPSPST